MRQDSEAPPRAAIDSLRGTLTMARILVETGRAIDLVGLEQDAASICATVRLLPREEALALRPLLLALLRDVTALAATLPEPR